MLERVFAEIDVKPGRKEETQSGIQMMRPRIYGAYEEATGTHAGRGVRTGAIVMLTWSAESRNRFSTPSSFRNLACSRMLRKTSINSSALVSDMFSSVCFRRHLTFAAQFYDLIKNTISDRQL